MKNGIKEVTLNFSLRWALTTVFLFIICSALVVISLTTMHTSEGILESNARKLMANISSLTEELARDHLALAQNATHMIQHFVSDGGFDFRRENFEAMEKSFHEQLINTPYIDGIHFGTPDGEFFFVSRSEKIAPGGFRTKIITNGHGTRSTKIIWRDSSFHLIKQETDPDDSYDPRKRPWYKKAKKENHIIITAPYISFTSKLPELTIAVPVKSKTGKMKGVAAANLEIDKLSSFLKKQTEGMNGKAFIFEKNGDIIAFPNLVKIKRNDLRYGTLSKLVKINNIKDPLTKTAFESIPWKPDKDGRLSLQDPRFSKFRHNGKTYHALFSPFQEENWHWIIGIYMADENYLGNLKKSSQNNLLLIFFVTTALAAVIVYLSGTVTRPLVNLKKEILTVGNHEMQARYNTNSRYKEIQNLTNAFKRMKKKLNLFATDQLKRENDMIRSERLITTGYLASSITDEINKPLQSILALLRALETKYKNNKTLSEDLELMKHVFMSLENTVTNFRALNQHAPCPMESHCVNDIIESTVEIRRESLSKNRVKTNLDLDPLIPDINVSSMEMSRLLINLINNSMEAISAQHEKALPVSKEPQPVSGTIGIQTRLNHPFIDLVIEDTGPGFSENKIPSLFKLLKSPPEGIQRTGLVICKEIVKECQGTIKAENINGKGARVTIKLPVNTGCFASGGSPTGQPSLSNQAKI